MKNSFIGILATALFLFFSTACASASRYAIIVDAGSSGSRLHLFQIDMQNNMPVIQDIFSESTKPGLSSYVDNPENAGSSLKKLIDDAIAKLNQNNINPNSVSISVMATAGMRLVPAPVQKRIYDNVAQFIQSNYTLTMGRIETIPGKMEGLYGWLDVNYLSHTFQNNQPSVGSIDLGGASTQIAYEINGVIKPTDGSVVLNINNHIYHIFAISFLGLGQDQALASVTQDSTANTCFPGGYPLANNTRGNFDFTTCSNLYNRLIEKSHVKNTIHLPTDKHFIAYAAIYYDLNFLNADKTPDRSIVESRIQSVCTTSWDQLQKNYPSIAVKYLAPACANETLVYDLLFTAYSLQANQLTVASQIEQHDIDWTLGAELYDLVSH